MGHSNVTCDDMYKLQEGLRMYIQSSHIHTLLERKSCEDLRNIEVSPLFALEDCSPGRRKRISTYLRRERPEMAECFSTTEWKLREQSSDAVAMAGSDPFVDKDKIECHKNEEVLQQCWNTIYDKALENVSDSA